MSDIDIVIELLERVKRLEARVKSLESKNIGDPKLFEVGPKSRFKPPTREEYRMYFKEKGYSLEVADRSYNGYDEANWKDSESTRLLPSDWL